MDVSIVIVNYNTKALVIDCINSIVQKTKDIDYEIIVVDNNSSDGSSEELKNKFSDVKIIENKENIGFGLANNKGFEIAKGKYLFCLNPDTILINNAVKILFDFMERNEDCAAAGGNLFDKRFNYVHSFGYGDDVKSLLLRRTYLKFFHFKEYLKIKFYEEKIDRTKVQEVNHITGADLMLRNSVIKELGGFAPEFFMYFEETELETRIKRAGYKIFFVPESKIIHLEGKTKNHKCHYYYNKSFIEYYRLCYGEAWAEIADMLINKK